MVPFARRVRTIRMCSLDARGEGTIQATLLNNQGEGKISEKKVMACWPPVLVERARSEGARSMHAVKGGLGHPFKRGRKNQMALVGRAELGK